MNGRPIKLLLDEHIWEGLAEALTQRGYDVIHILQLPPAELLKEVERLLTTLSADQLKNTVRWLQEFGADS